MATRNIPLPAFAANIPEPVAGVIAGVVAGAAYLAAQTTFATALGGSAAEPMQRIAAILMGPDVAPPPAEWSFGVLGMAVLIHFGLAMVFGRIVSVLVWRRTLPVALAIGAAVGLVLFGLNFELLAPSAFPWFDDSPHVVTAIDHAIFGALAAYICIFLRPRQPQG
jgi:hypothetical protein